MQGELAEPCADFAPSQGRGSSKSGTGEIGSSILSERSIFSTQSGSVYSCSTVPTTCSVKDVSKQRKRLQTLANQLGSAQIDTKRKAMKSCPRYPEKEDGSGRSKGSPVYIKELVDAIKDLPASVTRCS